MTGAALQAGTAQGGSGRWVLVDRVITIAALCCPLFLTHGRGLAEAAIDVAAIGFLLRSVLGGDWDWLRRPWVGIAALWWVWLCICSLPFGPFGTGGWPDLGQAVATVRFLLFAACLQHVALREPGPRRAMRWLIVICCLYIAAQLLLQAVLGHNLFGMKRFGDGTLTGPYDKPRAAAPLSRLLLPVVLAASAWIALRVVPRGGAVLRGAVLRPGVTGPGGAVMGDATGPHEAAMPHEGVVQPGVTRPSEALALRRGAVLPDATGLGEGALVPDVAVPGERAARSGAAGSGERAMSRDGVAVSGAVQRRDATRSGAMRSGDGAVLRRGVVLVGGAVLAGVPPLAGLAVMVLAGQRMPLLLSLLGLVVAGLLLRRLRPVLLGVLLAAPLLVAASAIVSPHSFGHLVLLFERQMSHFSRSPYGLIYTRAVSITLSNPLTGLGFDGFRNGCPDPTYFHSWPPWSDASLGDGGGAAICVQHAHNHVLQALTDAGVPGLLLFASMVIAWLVALGRGLWRPPSGASEVHVAWRVGLFAAVFIHEWPLASASAFTNMPLGGWFFLLLGVGLSDAYIERRQILTRSDLRHV